MPATPSAAARMLDHLITGAEYVSLHTGAPGATGAAELPPGPNYTRRPAGAFSPADAGRRATRGPVEFRSLPKCSVVAIGVWTAPTGGVLLWTLDLQSPVLVEAGGGVDIPAGGIELRLQ